MEIMKKDEAVSKQYGGKEFLDSGGDARDNSSEWNIFGTCKLSFARDCNNTSPGSNNNFLILIKICQLQAPQHRPFPKAFKSCSNDSTHIGKDDLSIEQSNERAEGKQRH